MSPRTYEEEPSVGDYRRSVASYDSSAVEEERELTLGTPTILGLFFVLAMVCACFFGLGYAMGHRAAPATPPVFDTATAPPSGAAKPAPGSAAVSETPPATDTPASPEAAPSGTQTATVPLTPSVAPSGSSAETSRATAAPSASAPQVSAAPIASGAFVVQVAAVSSQDVANILISTLEKKGYAVTVRQEPQDKLLHVQIGPFADRKEAEAMRQRVLADGFNAIVK